MPQVHETLGKFAILSSTARMPASCRGRYRQLALVELEGGVSPHWVRMLSPRAKGVKRVIWESGACNVGLTPKSAFGRALAEAEELLLAAAAEEEEAGS